jgi:hypothetical protein
MLFDESWLAAHETKMAQLRGEPTKTAPLLVEFSLPCLLKLPNRTLGHHWSKGHAYRKSLLGPMSEALAPWRGHMPIRKARVTVTRYTTGKIPDGDNTTASCKPAIDLLLVRSATHPHSLGVIYDDDPAHLSLIATAERVTRKSDQNTHFRIENIG